MIGFQFDRFQVLFAGQNFGSTAGDILSISVSRDGGMTWVDGFSADHNPTGVLKANNHTVFRITENLRTNKTPVDFAALDYDDNSYDIQLIAAAKQYGNNVYDKGRVYVLKNVAWAADQLGASYGTNVKRDLDFFVVGGTYWLSPS